jgi:hypothetical protein
LVGLFSFFLQPGVFLVVVLTFFFSIEFNQAMMAMAEFGIL